MNDTLYICLLISALVLNILIYFKMFLYVLSVIVIVLYIVHLRFNCNKRAQQIKKIPGPKDVFLFGNGLELLLDPGK